MTPSILSLATAVPPHIFKQEEIAEKIISILDIEGSKSEKIRKLYQNSAIQQRHTILPDFKYPRSEWHFWGSDYPQRIPGMSQRNKIYKKEAPKLAHQAASKALEVWGGDPAAITHVISVSCTGVMAPGIEFELISSLNLKRSVERLGINLMGCFGAFKGLAVAQAFAKENPKHRILLVCTELCSLHLQAEMTEDNLLGNALFSDGSAAVVVGASPQPQEKVLWEIVRNYSFGLDNSLERMSWEASDHGFLMKLSPYVPALIGRHIQSFTEQLLGSDTVSSSCDWAIHPGGKSIIQAIEKTMHLNENQTMSAWHTLAQYGNMSSSTFLFVLEHLYQQSTSYPWSIGVGFGPGLSIEGILLRKPK